MRIIDIMQTSYLEDGLFVDMNAGRMEERKQQAFILPCMNFSIEENIL